MIAAATEVFAPSKQRRDDEGLAARLDGCATELLRLHGDALSSGREGEAESYWDFAQTVRQAATRLRVER